MRLAFNGSGHYPDLEEGYGLYVRRSKKGESVDRKTYGRIIREYCRHLADMLIEYGIADLPDDMGYIAAAVITRKPQYRGKKFIGYGGMDWEKGHYDGRLKTFGMVFLPGHRKNRNLRSFGYVANRRLFKKMKERYLSGECDWQPIEFKDEMI